MVLVECAFEYARNFQKERNKTKRNGTKKIYIERERPTQYYSESTFFFSFNT